MITCTFLFFRSHAWMHDLLLCWALWFHTHTRDTESTLSSPSPPCWVGFQRMPAGAYHPSSASATGKLTKLPYSAACCSVVYSGRAWWIGSYPFRSFLSNGLETWMSIEINAPWATLSWVLRRSYINQRGGRGETTFWESKWTVRLPSWVATLSHQRSFLARDFVPVIGLLLFHPSNHHHHQSQTGKAVCFVSFFFSR